MYQKTSSQSGRRLIPQDECKHQEASASTVVSLTILTSCRLNIAIPFCVVHALDDPLVTWETVGSGYGLRHPANLTKANSNMFVVLTRGGGHVGWSTGLFPQTNKWKWMSDISMSFANAVKKQRVGPR